jgi:hypothetical protein
VRKQARGRASGRLARLCVLVTACALLAPVAAYPALQAVPAKRTDSMAVKNNGRTVEIRSPSGVGSGELKRIGQAWPASLTIRLKGLNQLEHFRVTAGDVSLVCALERLEGVSSQRACRLGDASLQPPAQRGRDFEVSLPPELLATHEDSMVVEWVDSWR